MKKYKMMYKCRECGEEFERAQTANEQIALSTINLITTGMHTITLYGNPISAMEVHFKDDHFGVADLIGCKIEEDENGTQGA